MEFEFSTAARIIFGPGTLERIGPIVEKGDRRALVVTGSDAARVAPLLDILAAHKIDYETFGVDTEPTTEQVREGIEQARAAECDFVIGIGGGSVIDAGKAIAALLTNGGVPLDYLEVVGRGQPITKPAAPYIAIPTTAGTGTEVTRNAVLASPEHGVKVSLRSPLILPAVALVDPELTYSLPSALTATTGLDALTQVLEPFVSPWANPMTDLVCRDGMRLIGRALRRAFEDGGDHAARQDMALAALYGGLALANAKLGAVHGFAGPLGGMFHTAPHGAVCGCLLPHVMAVNLQALEVRAPESEALRRYGEAACILTGDAGATARDGVRWVEALCEALKVPPLSTYGVTEDDFPLLVEKAAVSSSMRGNPIKLTPDEMGEILARAL